MANPEHLAILKRGVTIWNSWRETNHLAGRPGWCEVDLSRAKLRSAKLWEINLHEADLSGVDFRGATLHEANLSRANLEGAKLCDADLSEANLSRANLRGADLTRATLWGAYLCRTQLEGAILNEVVLGNTTFGDTDLRRVEGLATVTHNGPSHFDISTLLKSNAEISEAFLRGAGVPNEFIEYARSLVGQAIQFYSCFISYSTKDQDFADRLHADLQSKNVRCWFAPHNVQGGRKLDEQIDEAIRLHDKLLLVLSEDSMKSEWVNTEIAKARKREIRESRRMLFPVGLVDFETLREWECFDADTGKDSAREIRAYFIPDFSRWKDHDSYQAAFERLLSDLKDEGRSNQNKSSA